jgi:hypothetical protein
MYPPGILAPASPHQKLLPDAQVGGRLEWFRVRDNEYLAGEGLSGFSLLSLYPRGGELRRPAFSLPCLLGAAGNLDGNMRRWLGPVPSDEHWMCNADVEHRTEFLIFDALQRPAPFATPQY